MATVNDDVMTLPEVAAFFKVRLETIYIWCREPDFPKAFIRKRTMRFKRADIEAFWDEHFKNIGEAEAEKWAKEME